jgi:hypothetical protein
MRDPGENLIQNIQITPKEFHTEICLSLRNSKAKNFSPYSSRIASWNSQICAGTVAQVFILKWALGYNNPLFIFITNFTVVCELTH